MTRMRHTVASVVMLLVLGCSESGQIAAHHWIESQSVSAPAAGAMPERRDVIDTAPVAYNGALLSDPFSSRSLQTGLKASTDVAVGSPLIRFSSATLDGLQVVGLLKNQGSTVALISYSGRYENIRVGDLLGQDGAEVVSITSDGVSMRLADGSKTQLRFKKGST